MRGINLWLAAGLSSFLTLQAPGTTSTTAPAAGYLVSAFQRFPLVAFSEPRHAAGGTREFFQSLIRHPGFAGTVNDVVVEFGNARYQAIADRYTAGEPVPHDQLRQIW